MRSKKFSMELTLVLAVFAVMVLATMPAAAQSETILYNVSNTITPFNGPAGGLVADAAGNLYGTTSTAGPDRGGTVFELSPKVGGGWKETTLYGFSGGADGLGPIGSLLLDPAGNLYGTTQRGGDYNYGTVFDLKPNGSGGWTESVLRSFGQYDGVPASGLIADSAGNLYGTTVFDGYGYGEVFELSRNAKGTWNGQVLHYFNYNGTDGVSANGLVMDAAGNLYGTTAQGGSIDCGGVGCGTVFELSPSSSGLWTETILYVFHENGTDGIYPAAGLIFDSARNLYGTAIYGGTGPCTSPYGEPGCGIVFELMPGASGWTEQTLHNFNGRDGYWPLGLTFDAAGNLFGVTEYGGNVAYTCFGLAGCGTVFKLTDVSGVGWTETVEHIFSGGRRFTKERDGILPLGTLVLDASGNIFGTTYHGGNYGGYYNYDGGTVFEITP